jgi:hypothetical protein
MVFEHPGTQDRLFPLAATNESEGRARGRDSSRRRSYYRRRSTDGPDQLEEQIAGFGATAPRFLPPDPGHEAALAAATDEGADERRPCPQAIERPMPMAQGNRTEKPTQQKTPIIS